MIEPKIGEIAGYRTMIGAADVALFDNILPEFASAIGSRGVAERAKGAAFLGMDAILISGPAAGIPFEMSHLREAKDAAPGTPVIANTGVRADRVTPCRGACAAEASGTGPTVRVGRCRCAQPSTGPSAREALTEPGFSPESGSEVVAGRPGSSPNRGA